MMSGIGFKLPEVVRVSLAPPSSQKEQLHCPCGEGVFERLSNLQQLGNLTYHVITNLSNS